MNIATRVLEIKLDYWIKKRKLTIDKMLDLENNAKDKEAKSLELVLDTIQQVISDLTETIDGLNNIVSYEDSCFELINKKHK
jgi:hypothetical protein|tara:strand:+ start:199 stop:444 length:246 start_codon:yes stop_codon:yes gene_type:complete